VPDPPEIVVGLQPTLSPVEGDVEVVRVTVPVKLFTGDTVVVKEADPPELNVTLDGFAATVKSGWVLKNSVIALAFASFDARVGRFQLVSIVLVNE
jgi:hypothetical protein